MKDIQFIQINLIDYIEQKKIILNYKSKEFFIFGIEITDSSFANLCDYNLDPQHNNNNNNNNNNISAIEYLFGYQNEILELINDEKNILILVQKPDIDSIGSASLLNMFIKEKYELNGDLILRIKAISSSDKHDRGNWIKTQNYFYSKHYSIYGLPISLLTMIGYNEINLYEKIKNMEDYLITGIFDNMDYYSKLSFKKLKKAKKNTNIKIIQPNKLVFIESSYRGAIGLGYKKAPIVLARNKYYKFGNEENHIKGLKYTLAQYENLIDMNYIKNQLNNIENGWGGSEFIIGSPQNKPSKISDYNEILEIIKKEI